MVSRGDGTPQILTRMTLAVCGPSNTPSTWPLLLCFGPWFGLNNTSSSALLPNLFQFPPIISWTKVISLLWLHGPLNLSRVQVHYFYRYSCIFLASYANPNSSKGTFGCLLCPWPACGASLSISPTRATMEQVSSPVLSLTGEGRLC